MASNLTKRLDKIEKGIANFLESQNPAGPVYIAEGETVPEGREAIVIAMRWIEAEHHEELEDDQSVGAVTLRDNSAEENTFDAPLPRNASRTRQALSQA